MDLFRRFGIIAAAGDRHLAEFMPGTEYLKDPETVQDWQFGLTTVASRKQVQMERMEKGEKLAAGKEQVELLPSKEEGVGIIKALCGLGRFISNVNIPNESLVIPEPAERSGGGSKCGAGQRLHLSHYGRAAAESVRKLVLPHAKNHSLIVRAALETDFEAALAALMRDP